jgi:hypothetical protein
MKRKWKKAAILGPIGLTLWGNWPASAQDASAAPRGALPQAARASSQTPDGNQPLGPTLTTQVNGNQVFATTQSPQVSTPRARREAIAGLRNPWEWGGPADKKGLLGWIGSQASPQSPALPGIGAAPSTGLPGLEATPPTGAPAPPGALPGPPGGPPTAPGAPAPGVQVPGETAGGAAPGAQPPTTAPPAAPAPPAGAAEAFAEAAGGAGPGFGGGLGAVSDSLPMIGDRGPLFLRQNLRFPPIPPPFPPGIPRPGNNPGALAGRSVAAIVPAIRGFKIADNQYPRPVDRVWVNFNYYDSVNSGINDQLGAPIKNMQVYNETFGFEKTILDQQASVGFRIPVNTLTIVSGFPGLSGTHTSTGNFSSFFKYAVYDDNRGNLLSVGLDLSYPTGPRSFAGYPTILGINPLEIQPFFGYILRGDKTYLQGFNSIVVPTDRKLATMYYCDIGVGYFLYRSRDPRAILSSVVPSFETHLNIPLNWVGFQPRYIGGTPDIVDLTFGLNLGLSSRAVLSLAYVRPVTGPLPFGGEFAMMLNVPFGGRPGRNIPLTPPVFGR